MGAPSIKLETPPRILFVRGVLLSVSGDHVARFSTSLMHYKCMDFSGESVPKRVEMGYLCYR